jgi:hypothetical protein
VRVFGIVSDAPIAAGLLEAAQGSSGTAARTRKACAAQVGSYGVGLAPRLAI